MRSLSITILLFTVIAPSQLSAHTNHDNFAKKILSAEENGELIPNISQLASVGMSDAYKVQMAIIQNRLSKAKLSGFKAGLTSDATQSHFSVARPIFGALFSDGETSNQAVISLRSARKMMIETELGFITNKPIRKTIESVTELKSLIGQIVPVLELPEIAFAEQPVSGMDLVAANAAANCYIIDRNVNWLGKNINNVSVTLTHNGRIVNQGQGRDALGDQWEALRWLVNQVLYQGWNIDKGFLLITGVLGEMIPAEVGTYSAKYNFGSNLEFSFLS